MAKRKRDHKAEYARRKQLAKDAGLPSVRKYRAERKTLSLPRRTRLTPASRYRVTNKAWSDEHSRLDTSKWHPSFDDEKNRRYHNAFDRGYGEVERDEKLGWLYDYLVYYDLVTETEWRQNYLGLK